MNYSDQDLLKAFARRKALRAEQAQCEREIKQLITRRDNLHELTSEIAHTFLYEGNILINPGYRGTFYTSPMKRCGNRRATIDQRVDDFRWFNVELQGINGSFYNRKHIGPVTRSDGKRLVLAWIAYGKLPTETETEMLSAFARINPRGVVTAVRRQAAEAAWLAGQRDLATSLMAVRSKSASKTQRTPKPTRKPCKPKSRRKRST